MIFVFSTFQWLWKAVGQNLQTYTGFPKLVGECGGKNYHFVHTSADVESVVKSTVRSAFEYQGQKCSACSRMYVPESLWPQVKMKWIIIFPRNQLSLAQDSLARNWKTQCFWEYWKNWDFCLPRRQRTQENENIVAQSRFIIFVKLISFRWKKDWLKFKKPWKWAMLLNSIVSCQLSLIRRLSIEFLATSSMPNLVPTPKLSLGVDLTIALDISSVSVSQTKNYKKNQFIICIFNFRTHCCWDFWQKWQDLQGGTLWPCCDCLRLQRFPSQGNCQ